MSTTFRRDALLASTGRHIVSEPHLRIQILAAPPPDPTAPLFANYHGELLIVVLTGRVAVRTEQDTRELEAGDQLLLIDGEPFRITRADPSVEAIHQLIWAPGPNPCRSCFESSKRFYLPTE